jgi:hypothetical protein
VLVGGNPRRGSARAYRPASRPDFGVCPLGLRRLDRALVVLPYLVLAGLIAQRFWSY